jgi:hypothetical protein
MVSVIITIYYVLLDTPAPPPVYKPKDGYYKSDNEKNLKKNDLEDEEDEERKFREKYRFIILYNRMKF